MNSQHTPVEQLLALNNLLARSRSPVGDMAMINAYEVGLLRGLVRTLVALHPEIDPTIRSELRCLQNQMLCRERLGNTEPDGV